MLGLFLWVLSCTNSVSQSSGPSEAVCSLSSRKVEHVKVFPVGGGLGGGWTGGQAVCSSADPDQRAGVRTT